jgi:hypothetical protein
MRAVRYFANEQLPLTIQCLQAWKYTDNHAHDSKAGTALPQTDACTGLPCCTRRTHTRTHPTAVIEQSVPIQSPRYESDSLYGTTVVDWFSAKNWKMGLEYGTTMRSAVEYTNTIAFSATMLL